MRKQAFNPSMRVECLFTYLTLPKLDRQVSFHEIIFLRYNHCSCLKGKSHLS